VLGLSLCLLGCARDPAPAVCPHAVAGDLAVTEIRGKQSPDDALGQWIEIANTTASTIDLEGVLVRIRRRDGTNEADVLVRRALPLAAHGYAVLGLFEDTARPSYVDYGFAGDFQESWLSSAAIDVDACGTVIDRATYDALPTTGTYSLGGTPSADRNDLSPSWCTNPIAAGSPQQANPACP
jgi:hypothetical protein